MSLAIEIVPGEITVIRPIGRLDLRSAAEFKQELARIIGDHQHRLVIDMEAITFLDSSGLGALISGLKAARLAGGDLRIARPGEQARVILMLTTLDKVLKPYPTMEEALADY